MRPMLTAGLAAALALTIAAGHARAEGQAELVETKVIWDQGPDNAFTDLVRFQDRWFCVCREGREPHPVDGVLRVLTSADGAKWESAALLKATADVRGLHDPKLAVLPDGRLMVSAGGSTRMITALPLAWLSKDGRDWDEPGRFGDDNYLFGRTRLHKDTAYTYGCGCICGNAQTVQIATGRDGKAVKGVHEYTMSGAFPGEGALLFEDDVGYCLMGRTNGGPKCETALVGTAKAPFKDWEWKKSDALISDPNLVRLPDGRTVAAVGLWDKQARTSLCWFDPAAGKLKEFLELPTNNKAIDVGLVWHDGHLWVSYHATDAGKFKVYLARVKLK